MRATDSVADSLVLPVEMVGARLALAALGALLVLRWYHTVGRVRVPPSVVNPTLTLRRTPGDD